MSKKPKNFFVVKKATYSSVTEPRDYYSQFEREFKSKSRNPYGVGLNIPSFEVNINKAINDNKSFGEVLAIFEMEYFILKNKFLEAEKEAKEFFKKEVIYLTKSKEFVLINKYDQTSKEENFIHIRHHEYQRIYGGVTPEFLKYPYIQKHKIKRDGANFFISTVLDGIHYFSDDKIHNYSIRELELNSFKKILAYHAAYNDLMTGVIRMQSLLTDLSKHCPSLSNARISSEAPCIPLDKVTIINGWIHENAYLRLDFDKKLNFKVEVKSVDLSDYDMPDF